MEEPRQFVFATNYEPTDKQALTMIEASPDIISNILQTGKAIADAYRSKNKNEWEALDRLVKLFER